MCVTLGQGVVHHHTPRRRAPHIHVPSVPPSSAPGRPAACMAGPVPAQPRTALPGLTASLGHGPVRALSPSSAQTRRDYKMPARHVAFTGGPPSSSSSSHAPARPGPVTVAVEPPSTLRFSGASGGTHEAPLACPGLQKQHNPGRTPVACPAYRLARGFSPARPACLPRGSGPPARRRRCAWRGVAYLSVWISETDQGVGGRRPRHG